MPLLGVPYREVLYNDVNAASRWVFPMLDTGRDFHPAFSVLQQHVNATVEAAERVHVRCDNHLVVVRNRNERAHRGPGSA